MFKSKWVYRDGIASENKNVETCTYSYIVQLIINDEVYIIGI